MEIKKIKQEEGPETVSITKGTQEFKMFYGGNGDLYWEIINHHRSCSEEEFFSIDKENYALYSSFERLYNRIANCDIYSIDPLELELCETPEDEAMLEETRLRLNERARQSSSYHSLYSKAGISFVSDEDIPFNENNIVTIVKSYDGESFIIQISKASPERETLDIRFRSSGSRYQDFVPVFLKQYQELIQEDFDYHQIHLEEIMYQKKLAKKYPNPKSDN